MKKLFLVGALALSSLFASAQEGLQGAWFAGGSFSLGNVEGVDVEGDPLKGDSYSVMPLLGYFVSPSVAVGGAIGYEYTKFDETDGYNGYYTTPGQKTNTFVVMPFARKYWNITGNLYFFGQASLPVVFGNTKKGEGSSELKTNNFGLEAQLSPGFDWVVTNWFTVEASFVVLSGGYASQKPKGGKTSSTWSVNGNSISSSKFGDLTVGVKFLF